MGFALLVWSHVILLFVSDSFPFVCKLVTSVFLGILFRNVHVYFPSAVFYRSSRNNRDEAW